MYYTVYKITNLINGKIYIGAHRTANLDDSYMGSGDLIKRAIRKYGIDNFEKTYLAILDTPEQMFELESKLVNEEFVFNSQTYNRTLGGAGANGGRNEYASMQQANAKRLAALYAEYENNLTRCRQCDNQLPYRRRTDTFCNKSCAAKFNNRSRKKSKQKQLTEREKYELNPKMCVECEVVQIKFEQRKYSDCCSRSCAATQRNRGRVVSDTTRQKIAKKIAMHHAATSNNI